MLLSVFSKLGNASKKGGQLEDWPKYAEQLEQTVDNVNRAAVEIQKGVHQNVFARKQNKKCTDAQLAAVFKKASEKRYGDRMLFPCVLEESANVMQELSSYRQEYESQVDKLVCVPLNYLSTSTCAEIGRSRRALSKATADMRAARDQFYKAQVQASAFNSCNFTAEDVSNNMMLMPFSSTQPNYENISQARVQNLQEQVSVKENELLDCREHMMRGLYSFALMEENYAQYVIEFHRQQEAYFEKCLEFLKASLLQLNVIVQKHRPVICFGQSLSTHLAETGRSIAYPLHMCIRSLNNEEDLSYEGLFRKSGSVKRVELLVKALSLMQVDELLIATSDPSVVSAAIKQYLNSLPEPLVTFNFATKWSNAVSSASSASPFSADDSLNLVTNALREMPTEYFRNLAYLCRFLARVAARSATNKMTPSNLSIVIAPNIYWLPKDSSEGDTTGSNLDETSALLYSSGLAIQLLELLIEKASVLFPNEVEPRNVQPSAITSSNRSRASTFIPTKLGSLTDLGCVYRPSRASVVAVGHHSDEELESSCRDDTLQVVHIPTAFKSSDDLVKPNFTVPRKKKAAPRPPSDAGKDQAEIQLTVPSTPNVLPPDAPPTMTPADSTPIHRTPPLRPTRLPITLLSTPNSSPGSQISPKPS